MGLEHSGFFQRGARLDRHKEKARATFQRCQSVRFKANVLGLKIERPRGLGNAGQRHIRAERNNRRGKLGPRMIANARDLDRYQPRFLLQADLRLEAAARLVFQFSQQHGAAHGGMPGEGHLPAGKENPYLRRVGRIIRFHHEDRFRKVELAGDRLHLLRRQSIGAKHHRQRIAAEAAVGENIKGVEGKLHGAES